MVGQVPPYGLAMTTSLALPEPRLPISVRTATMDDLPFLDELQRGQTKAVGYFPRGQFMGYIEQEAVLIAHAADDPTKSLGYIISKDRYLKRDELGVVYQLNVVPEARRMLVGAALLKEAFERSAYGCRLYCCWCAQDLPANRYWESMGFVPVAFRAGSDKKRRVHIFWQKRINDGDIQTPWWYPFQTNGGAMRADRLAFPIPPGTHWSEVEAVSVPTTPMDGPEPKALPKPRKKRAAKAEPVVMEKVAVFVGGRTKYVERPVNRASKKAAGGTAPGQGSEDVKALHKCSGTSESQEKPAKPKVDPQFIKLNRELRDRYLEQANAEPDFLLPAGKYDAKRLPEPMRLAMPAMEMKQLPQAAKAA